LQGAIADYTAVDPSDARSRDMNVLYNRGFAYEKLGEMEKAIADYTAAIEISEKFAPPWDKDFDSVVPRDGYDLSRISLDDLKEIRERLAEQSDNR
jgi:tetratricopeptide (TPR) repeat protein